MVLSSPLHSVARAARPLARSLTTLSSNPKINVFSSPKGPQGTSVLTYLASDPPNPDLAIGTTTAVPPNPDSVTENPHFLEVLQAVVAENATKDPVVQAAAKAFASQGGTGLGSGGAFFPHQTKSRDKRRPVGGGGGAGTGGAGGASAQGGMGSAGRNGFVHVSDQRNPPDWGRVAWPEDIFGSVEVDGEGNFVGARGGYQKSGTYRVITNEGILGLSPFLQEKLIERLKELEKDLKR